MIANKNCEPRSLNSKCYPGIGNFEKSEGRFLIGLLVYYRLTWSKVCSNPNSHLKMVPRRPWTPWTPPKGRWIRHPSSACNHKPRLDQCRLLTKPLTHGRATVTRHSNLFCDWKNPFLSTGMSIIQKTTPFVSILILEYIHSAVYSEKKNYEANINRLIEHYVYLLRYLLYTTIMFMYHSYYSNMPCH